MWKSTHPSLLLRLRNPGDHGAWADFDLRYGDLIVRYCLGRGLQLADAEDVRQVVLMNLARALPKFTYSPSRGRFRSYLGTAVRNAIGRLARRPNRVFEWLVNDEETLDAAARIDGEGDDLWEKQWAEHHLRLALQTVGRTFDKRSVLVFTRLLEGASVEEVASETAMTAAAVHKVKQRVRDRLHSVVADQIEEEDRAL